MRVRTALIGLLLLTGLGVPRAGAQFGRGRGGAAWLDTSRRGDGRLEIGRNTTRSLDQVRLVLRRDGDAEVRFYRGGTPYVFTGRWSGDRARAVDLELNRRDDVPIRASGHAYFRASGELARIAIDGEERGQRLSVTFRAEGEPFDYLPPAGRLR